ncbi:hypothetical protein H3H36_07620 [Duganella sp. FT3S]|uniref:Uncharacterized protein n=1 Tax=Rugamonas fusca TaxID=2758568 RepID=A0A7W2I6E5_9BURK|nr:hypothetical protein [Rugamonas fusca]MBA5605223.1 hypothetical protein [Rugamonas fusca]
MTTQPLNILGAELRRRSAEALSAAAPCDREPRQLLVEVDNPGGVPLHVWTSRRAYEYDAASGVLTLYLTERTPALPDTIKMISDHPRTPSQVEVPPHSRATLELGVPAVIRRRVPAKGLGMAFVEQAITRIDQVELHIQFADTPFDKPAGATPEEHRQRLRTQGELARATISPTGTKE